jgi:hypothetical protein
MNIRTINQNKHFYKSKRFLFFVLQKIRNLLHNHFITIFFFKTTFAENKTRLL